jgi:ribosomal protein S18 acetylase RimI-like enzyme
MENELADFLISFMNSSESKYFHPHPMDEQEARKIASYSGSDLYYGLFEDEKMIGYGMLRGWDEGYIIPSLGIALKDTARGQKLGEMFMHFLHIVARVRGSKKVRLKVYPSNIAALNLYKKLGYKFSEIVDNQLVGILDLKQ